MEYLKFDGTPCIAPTRLVLLANAVPPFRGGLRSFVPVGTGVGKNRVLDSLLLAQISEVSAF